jgi:hypothetical protein
MRATKDLRYSTEESNKGEIMNSFEFGHIRKEFETWHSFEKRSLENAPREKGVYIIRQAAGKSFGRLQGESDLFYIGSTESKGGLRQRLLAYFHPGRTQWTNQRINDYLRKYRMEVAWCPCGEPTNLEHDLLRRYLKDHDELPPFNHADIRRLYKAVADQVVLSDKVTVIKTEGKQN